MSKGGTSSVEIPAWLENAAIENINRARDVQSIGYVPYYGPDVAAMTPMQEQAMRATGGAAQAFGLAGAGFDPLAGMPTAQTFEGGVRGYSSAPLYEAAIDTLREKRPGQVGVMEGMFVDPDTGRYASGQYAPTVAQIAQTNYAQAGDTAAVTDALLRSPEYVESLFEPAADGGTGYYGGPELPKDIVRGLSDEQFEAYTLAEGLQPADPTTGIANWLDDAVEDYASSGGLLGTGLNYLQALINPPEPVYTTSDSSVTYQDDTIPGFTLDGGLPAATNNLTYSDPAEEALMSQYIPQQDVQIGTIEPQNIVTVDPGTYVETDYSDFGGSTYTGDGFTYSSDDNWGW